MVVPRASDARHPALPRPAAVRAGNTFGATLLLAASLAGPSVLAQAPSADPAPAPASYPIIASVRIDRTDVFDVQEAADHPPYDLANRLHILTREKVIRQELLFKEGDPADPDVLYESERNLRRLSFLHPNSRIETVPGGDGRVDVVVHTRDAWTTRPDFSLKREGNRTTGRFGLKEANLLGRGKSVEVDYRRDLDRTSDGLEYTDPRLLGSRWALHATHFSRSDGLLYSLDAERPFYSLLTPRAGGGGGSHFSQVTTLHLGGHDAPGFRQAHSDLMVHWARAFEAGYESVRRLDLRFRLDEDRFAVEPGEGPLSTRPPVGGAGYVALPDDRRFRVLEAEYQSEKVDFIKVNYLDKFDRLEDLNLRGNWAASLGVSPAFLGDANTHLVFGGRYERWLRPSLRTYLHATASTEGRYLAGTGQHVITSFELTHYYVRPPRQTLVLHLAQDWGHNLDGDFQFLLGGDTGLRGYDARRFDGNKRLLANLEHRTYLVFDWLHLLSVGFAGFADAGYAWRAGESEDLGDLVGDVGVGLRFDVTRGSTGSVFRIDYGYPVSQVGREENPHGVLSFASGLAF